MPIHTPGSRAFPHHLGFAALDFARLFVVPAVAQLLERAFLVEFLLQPAEGTVDDLAFLDADFGIHDFFTPFRLSVALQDA